MQVLAGRRGVPVLAAAATVWAMAVPAASTRVATDSVVRSFVVPPDQALAIAVTVGTVTITGDPARRDVRVTVTREAPSPAGLARLPVQWRETPEGPALSLVQADAAADPELRTDVVVAAPVDVGLDTITIAEGRLVLRQLRGAVRARVARGDIEATDVGGVQRLETTIGSITVKGATLAAGGLLRLRTFNGDVRLALAAPLRDARVMALALNGTIESAVPLTHRDGWGPRWAEASLGATDRLVSIDVVSGVIRLEAPAR